MRSSRVHFSGQTSPIVQYSFEVETNISEAAGRGGRVCMPCKYSSIPGDCPAHTKLQATGFFHCPRPAGICSSFWRAWIAHLPRVRLSPLAAVAEAGFLFHLPCEAGSPPLHAFITIVHNHLQVYRAFSASVSNSRYWKYDCTTVNQTPPNAQLLIQRHLQTRQR